MIATGLDVHAKNTTVAYLDTDTGEFAHRTVPTHRLSLELADREPENMRIALEASAVGLFIARTLISCGFCVVVVDAFKAHRIIESQNIAKTDKRDAMALAKLLANGQADELSIWVPDDKTRELRQLTRSREALVKVCTQLRNQLRAIIRSEGQECRFKDLTGRGGRRWMEQFIAAMPPDAALACRAVWEALLDIKDRIDALGRAIEDAVDTYAPAQLLMTIPGCGAILALTIAVEIGDVKRFLKAKKLCGYSGLVPRVRQSGESSWTGPLVKQGNAHLRRAMVLLAQQVAGSSALQGTRLKRGHYRVLRKSGPNPAKAEVARHLLHVIFAMLRDGTSFDAELMAA